MAKTISLSNDDLVKCYWCERVSSVAEWMEKTYASCLTREMRRSVKHLSNKGVWMKNSKNSYMCPICENLNRGNILRLIDKSTGKVVKGLGNMEAIKFIEKKTFEEDY